MVTQHGYIYIYNRMQSYINVLLNYYIIFFNDIYIYICYWRVTMDAEVFVILTDMSSYADALREAEHGGVQKLNRPLWGRPSTSIQAHTTCVYLLCLFYFVLFCSILFCSILFCLSILAICIYIYIYIQIIFIVIITVIIIIITYIYVFVYIICIQYALCVYTCIMSSLIIQRGRPQSQA